MEIAVSLNSAYAVDDPRVGARRMIERAEAADGLDGLYLGDHHAVGVPYYQNGPMLGRLAAGWSGPAIGALYLLPLWHPVTVAEQVGTLAALSESRFVLQVAIGGGDDQFAAFGLTTRDRVARFESSLDVVTRLLAGEPLDGVETPWGPVSGSISPVPPEPVEVWIGGDVPAALDRAARLGDAWYAGPQTTDAELVNRLGDYRARLAEHGRDAAGHPVRFDVFVGADEEEVEQVVEPVLAAGYRGGMPRDALIFGTVEQVAERFAALEAIGFTQVVTRQLSPDQGAAVASTARLHDVRSLLASG
jgi:alkanesulfonate monooxygenase SsuD/methylene tetrahydromethanopterin reductase-like flavin-dependent oxidoreductase (luciferase family)